MTMQFGDRPPPLRVPPIPRRAAPSGAPAPVQQRANAGPYARELSAVREMLNGGPRAAAPAHPSAPPVQRMRWRKQREDIVPEDPGFRGAPNVRDGYHIPYSWDDGDLWDDVTGNVYHGATGLLRYNHRTEIGDDAMLPQELREQLDAYNANPDVSTAKKADSFRVRLNALRGKINQWLQDQDPVERHENGSEKAALRALARIDALQRNRLYPQTEIDPGEAASISLSEASERLYRDVQPAGFAGSATRSVDSIDSRVSDAAVGQQTIDTHDLQPQGQGLRWWASAAMGLRGAAAAAPRGALLGLDVGTGRVPIGVRPPDAHHPGGEFIVLGHQAPVVHDQNPDQVGLRTPGSAQQEHRVSYPAFMARLTTFKNNRGLTDPQIALAMLQMVRNPGADPDGLPVEVLPALRELLVTWMVAEPARHRSVLFNSVLSLNEVAGGRATFDEMLNDDGLHPMTGAGTAKAGRQAEQQEAGLREGRSYGDLVTPSRVVRRQRTQLERTTSDGTLSTPLENVLRTHGIGGMNLRPVPR